ncbi:MAG: sodium:proton antiporter [Lachnospiraceae bacterium]|nr:sodium:proton antiporter [Lachnospiraceae bacterium]
MITVAQAYNLLYTTVLLCLALLIALALIRAVKGPRITDRLISVNMIGTMVIVTFFLLTLLLNEGFLADVALVYALISFVSVLIFAVVYIRRKGE